MICIYCKQHFAPFPDEDFINDLPSPPGKGIIARNEELHKRRMKVYWNDEPGECGCDEQNCEVMNDGERSETVF